MVGDGWLTLNPAWRMVDDALRTGRWIMNPWWMIKMMGMVEPKQVSMTTTYLDGLLRVSRNEQGQVFVFARADDAEIR